MLTTEEQEIKYRAVSAFSDMTSARNPDRIPFMLEFLEKYEEYAKNLRPLLKEAA